MHPTDASDNTRMRQFADPLGFRHERDPDDATLVLYSVDLSSNLASSSSRRSVACKAASMMCTDGLNREETSGAPHAPHTEPADCATSRRAWPAALP